MEKKISVIIPVYNVALYLEECLNSVVSQSYTNLEILLIDDGSTDHSGAICDQFASIDSRIKVIHQKNAGAAAAKNAGLRAATGAYLSFVDSDDYLEPGAYSHMVSLLEAHGADVLQCAYRDVYRDRKEDQLRGTGLEILSAADYLLRYTTDWTCGLLWDKLYQRHLFDDFFFEEGHKIDDEYFTYRGIMNAGKVLCDGRIIYNYRKRRSSVMFSPESAARILLDRVDYLDKRRRNVVARFPELRRVFDLHFLDSMLYLSTDRSSSAQSITAIRSALRTYFREKGHTAPPMGWWLPLLKLRLGVVSPSSPRPADDPNLQDDFFD